MATTQTDAKNVRINDRDRRALTEYLTVLPDQGRARDAPGMALVVSESGSEYLVDVRDGACTCPDAEYRDVECKHIRRARFATGADAIPAAAAAQLDVDPDLGEHTAADLQFATADGGIIEAPDDGVVLDDEPDDECACEGLPDDVPCADCYIAGEAEFGEGR